MPDTGRDRTSMLLRVSRSSARPDPRGVHPSTRQSFVDGEIEGRRITITPVPRSSTPSSTNCCIALYPHWSEGYIRTDELPDEADADEEVQCSTNEYQRRKA